MRKIFEMSDARIAFCGPGGVGKSTLVDYLSSVWDLDIVKHETSANLPDGINNHADVIKYAIDSPEDSANFQYSLAWDRANLFSCTTDGFISDRSPVDSLMYYELQNSHQEIISTQLEDNLLDRVIQSLYSVDLTVVVIPKRPINRTEDKRINSIGYFRAQRSYLYGFMHDLWCNDLHYTEIV